MQPPGMGQVPKSLLVLRLVLVSKAGTQKNRLENVREPNWAHWTQLLSSLAPQEGKGCQCAQVLGLALLGTLCSETPESLWGLFVTSYDSSGFQTDSRIISRSSGMCLQQHRCSMDMSLEP